jgi:hypothetical protein
LRRRWEEKDLSGGFLRRGVRRVRRGWEGGRGEGEGKEREKGVGLLHIHGVQAHIYKYRHKGTKTTLL